MLWSLVWGEGGILSVLCWEACFINLFFCMYKKWVVLVLIIFVLLVVGGFLSVTDLSFDGDTDSAVYEIESPKELRDVSVRITNTSKYPVASGVVIVHGPDFSLSLLGQTVPAPYESLAEVGDPTAVAGFLQGLPGVYDVFESNFLDSRESQRFVVPFFAENALLSYVAMIVPTNDGVVWLNGEPLYGVDGTPQYGGFVAEVLDMGFEQNSPIGSGFAGGQLDLSRGDENIDNGVSLREPADHHPQFYDDPAVSPDVVKVNLNS